MALHLPFRRRLRTLALFKDFVLQTARQSDNSLFPAVFRKELLTIFLHFPYLRLLQLPEEAVQEFLRLVRLHSAPLSGKNILHCSGKIRNFEIFHPGSLYIVGNAHPERITHTIHIHIHTFLTNDISIIKLPD